MIIKWQHPCKFLDHAEYALCILIDLDVSLLAVTDVHLAILFHLGNAKVEDFARAVFAAGFSGWNQGGIFVINSYKNTETIADLVDTAFTESPVTYGVLVER